MNALNNQQNSSFRTPSWLLVMAGLIALCFMAGCDLFESVSQPDDDDKPQEMLDMSETTTPEDMAMPPKDLSTLPDISSTDMPPDTTVNLRVEPASTFEFKPTKEGSSSSQIVTLFNDSNQEVTLGEVTIKEQGRDGVNEVTFDTQPEAKTLAQGQALVLNLLWTPVNDVTDFGTIEVEVLQPKRQFVSLAYTTSNVIEEDAPSFPSSTIKTLEFKDLPFAQTASQSITIDVSGDKLPLLVDSVSLEYNKDLNSDAKDQLKLASKPNDGTSYQPGDSFEVEITTTPTDYFQKQADLVISSKDQTLRVPITVNTKRPSLTATMEHGYEHACALDRNQKVHCWGKDDKGQVSGTPTSGKYVSIITGVYHTCTLDAAGNATCWGQNDHGESSAPSKKFKQVVAGYWHTCGLLPNDEIECWGVDLDGRTEPPAGKFVKLYGDFENTCALGFDAKLTCWGSNLQMQNQPPDKKWRTMAVGLKILCGLDLDRKVNCWGFTSERIPETPPSGQFETISVNQYVGCVIDTGSNLKCWGQATNQGLSEAPPSAIPSQVSVGRYSACMVENERMKCWGDLRFGITMPPDIRVLPN